MGCKVVSIGTFYKGMVIMSVIVVVNICLWINEYSIWDLWPSKDKHVTFNARLLKDPYFRNFCMLPTCCSSNGCSMDYFTYFDKYRERCEASKPPSNTTVCACFPDMLVGWEKQDVTIPIPDLSLYNLNAEALGIEAGGRWRPPHCRARQKVAIIVPYRNRPQQLVVFLHRMHPFLQRQQHTYQIFVVQQNAPQTFSRSTLMNVGFLEANKSSFDCFIFSDVDLLPEDDRYMYDCFYSPLHIGAYVSKFKYKVAYPSIFGGITALSPEHVKLTNLFSNRFYGWGGEDDDLFNRVMSAGLIVNRYPSRLSRTFMIVHEHEKENRANPMAHDGTLSYTHNVYVNDGVAQTRYQLLNKTLMPLYTLLDVDLLPTQSSEDCLLEKGVDGAPSKYLECWGDVGFKAGKIDCCGKPPVCCHKLPHLGNLLPERIYKMIK